MDDHIMDDQLGLDIKDLLGLGVRCIFVRGHCLLCLPSASIQSLQAHYITACFTSYKATALELAA